MPPKGKGNSKSAAAAAVVGGGGGRGSGRGGKGKGEVKKSIVTKGNGKGNVIASSESNDVHTGGRINNFAAGEDRAAKIRKVKHVESHRKGDDRIVRAILAPAVVCAVIELSSVIFRSQSELLLLHFLLGQMMAATLRRDMAPLKNHRSLLRSLSSDEQGDDNEAILSMLTVHSLLLMVTNFYLPRSFLINL